MNIPYAIFQITGGQNILLLNLPLIVAIRVVYWIALWSRYRLDQKPGRFFLLGWKSRSGFIIKEIIIIGLSSIYIYLVILVGLYTFLTIGSLSWVMYKKESNVFGRVIHIISFSVFGFVIPIALIIYGIIASFWIELVFGAVGIALFFPMGHKIAERNLQESNRHFQNYNFKNSSRVVKVLILIGIFLIPTAAISYRLGYKINQIMLPMRDGVKLATRVYMPAVSDGPQPVILMRTPYNQDALKQSAIDWVIKGYIAVTQDFRGLFYSDGQFQAFMASANDGYDTCKWITQQSWCNGKIATIGGSALAINQYLFAGQKAPGLLAQELDFGAPEIYDNVLFNEGGVWRKTLAETWINLTSTNSLLFQGKSTATAMNMAYEFLAHPDKTEWWTNGSLSMGDKYQNVSARAVHFGGWFDIFTQGTLDGFMGYNHNGTANARDHQKLIIGPYTHGGINGVCGQVTFPNAQLGVSLQNEWMDQILAESMPGDSIYPQVSTTDLWNGTNVAYYMMGDVSDPEPGANEWRFASDWPVPCENTPFYMESNQSLSVVPSNIAKNTSFIYNPKDPVPTLGGNNLVLAAGMYDQRPVMEGRSDIVTFETQPLTKPLEITGNVNVKLYFTSNCTDTDFSAKLTDLYPNGTDDLIMDGITNVEKRDGLNEIVPIIPGKVYELSINLWSTAYHFNTGHQIQLTISSSNYPKYQACPNTGTPLALNYNTTYDANNTIIMGGPYNSCVYLPITSY